MNANQVCQNCKRVEHNAYLCGDCIITLQDMIDQLPFLLVELETTIHRRDKLTTGAVGHSSENPAPINLGAMELRRTVAQTINAITREIHLDAKDIARHPKAGHHYRAIQHLVGDNQLGGQLVTAINRNDRQFAGPCPTTRAHRPDGTPIPCGRMLYAQTDQKTVTCPHCRADIDVAKNRIRAATDRDIVTEKRLLEILDGGEPLCEKVSRDRLYQWLRERRIQPVGWLHNGAMVHHHIRRGDPRLFSLADARRLYRQDQEVNAQ